MISAIGRLRRLGIMGLNQRNADYIMDYNPRRLFPLVDDKTQTKKLAMAAGIAVPALYGVIETEHQIRELDGILETHGDFVVKPAHGSGGNGILVITGRRNKLYQRASGLPLSRDALHYQISNILNGLYSLGGYPDQALIEYRVKFDPLFEKISYQGVPDIRTIVYRGMPVMAMLRLPTRMSDGKANLHQGAVGAGINMGSGRTLQGVWLDHIVDEHPDSGHAIAGLEIPSWEHLLTLSAHCQKLVGLGYLGVDIVLDNTLGPLMLELNARPGLSIQLANREGMLKRLHAVDALACIPDSASERARLAQRLFASRDISPNGLGASQAPRPAELMSPETDTQSSGKLSV